MTTIGRILYDSEEQVATILEEAGFAGPRFMSVGTTTGRWNGWPSLPPPSRRGSNSGPGDPLARMHPDIAEELTVGIRTVESHVATAASRPGSQLIGTVSHMPSGNPNRYTAAICMRGHWSCRALENRGVVDPHCQKCGAPIITACQSCGSRLLGGYPNVLTTVVPQPDKFCYSCGSPYPWADRDDLILALRNKLEFEPGLDAADRLELTEQVAVLSRPENDEKVRIRRGHRRPLYLESPGRN